MFSSLGATLSNNIFLSEFSLLNIKLGADINTEIRDSYKENLYFTYDRLALVQVQPRVEADLKIGFSERSNIFLNVGIEAREVISGQTQDYSMGDSSVWGVEVTEWQAVPPWQAPSRVTIRGTGLEIKVIISQWEFSPAP